MALVVLGVDVQASAALHDGTAALRALGDPWRSMEIPYLCPKDVPRKPRMPCFFGGSLSRKSRWFFFGASTAPVLVRSSQFSAAPRISAPFWALRATLAGGEMQSRGPEVL